MKISALLVTALVAAFVAFGTVKLMNQTPATPAAAAQETAFERVTRTGVLRCGYGAWEPAVMKDPATGKMSGLFVEMVEEMAKMARFKVEWASEVDWGQIQEALRSGKVDAFCSAMAGDAFRGKYLAYTNPLSYFSFDVLVRADDDRFPRDRPLTLDDINKPAFRMAYTEGDVLQTLVETELPQITGVPLPPLGTPADNIMNLISGKTDLIIFPRVIMENYEKHNGTGKIRLLTLKEPLRVYGNVIAVDINDTRLWLMLNAAVNEFVNSSSYGRIMAPYEAAFPGAFLRPAKTYLPPP